MPHTLMSVLLMLAMLPFAVSAQAQQAPLALETVASGFDHPVHVTNAGDNSGRIFVTERSGTVRIVHDGSVLPTPFLDIGDRIGTSGEQGLLSIAFPPGFALKRHFYAYYGSLNGDIVISRFTTSADPDIADAQSEEVLLRIAHPRYDNHYGGQLAFGPDGYLYAGTGDGGGAGDPQGNAQNPVSLLGKILRLDVESGPDTATDLPYRIPPDNPFASGDTARPEIWAMGLRNPWRFSFDRATGDLWIGDVGQNRFEEIDRQPAGAAGGANYGWNILEGDECYPEPGCTPPQGYVPPVATYGRDVGHAVTGGYVYHGPGTGVRGMYVFGDFVTGRLFSLRRQDSGWSMDMLAETDASIVSFGEDQSGRLYLCDYTNGTLQRLRFPITSPAAVIGMLVLPRQ